jgi:hypothetical protein
MAEQRGHVGKQNDSLVQKGGNILTSPAFMHKEEAPCEPHWI